MHGFSLPVDRLAGRAIVVGKSACRSATLRILADRGYMCAEADDPYQAMAELARNPRSFRAVILSLASLYREELAIVRAIRRRFPHIEIWISDFENRSAALAEATGLGADGLLSEEGLHRFAAPGERRLETIAPPMIEPAEEPAQPEPAPRPTPPRAIPTERVNGHHSNGQYENEPVLTTEELRALLQDDSPRLHQESDH